MGMVDQVYRLTELEPLPPRLKDIQAVLDQIQAPGNTLSEADAVARIARLIRQHDEEQPIYQKPWG